MAAALSARAESTQLRIEPPGGYEPDLVLAILAAHALPGVEASEPEARRHIRTVFGPLGPLTVALTLDPDAVLVSTPRTRPAEGDLEFLDALVRRWLDLDTDAGEVCARFAGDPVLRPLAAVRPGMRVLGYPDPFEAAVVTVLGQHVSVKAARVFGGRLSDGFGIPTPGGFRAFPTPESLRGVDASELQRLVGVTSARAVTLLRLAQLFSDGYRLADDGPGLPVLRALPGIGQWTVDYLELRSTGDRDAFPAGDLVLRRAMGVATPAQAIAAAEPWRPFRAYATFHLWAAAAYPLPPHRAESLS